MIKLLGMHSPLVSRLFASGLLLLLAPAHASAQSWFAGRFRPQPLEGVVQRFDRDGDGCLDEREREAAREYVREARSGRNSSSSSVPTLPLKSSLAADLLESAASSPGGPVDLYDDRTLRTLYLRFPAPDWFAELQDFYNTDVEVPADLVVDGRLYPAVGVRFRGNSSYWTTGSSLKKSFNVSLDCRNRDQRLYGYRTLNLLNSHADPSFLREVLYSRISRHYLPAPKANFVRLVINGENWGVYLNVQQFNRDFSRDWFGTDQGVRFKVPPGRSGAGALLYRGPEPASYRSSFELNSQDSPRAWADLIELCRILNQTPLEELEEKLKPVLDIDGALWFLALENAFIDSDGYFSRGADYLLYQHPDGRFHLITHDNNETFRYAGGGGPNRWPSSDPMLSPVGHEDNPQLPLISRLLAVPQLRARYLAHLRTIAEQWLDWRVLEPIVEEYRSLIDRDVRSDNKKLYSYEAFAASLGQDSGWSGGRSSPSLRAFVEERRAFLLSHPQLDKPVPRIGTVRHQGDPQAAQPIRITAQVSAAGGPQAAVLLHYCVDGSTLFRSTAMFDDGAHQDGSAADGLFAAEIEPLPAGTLVRYYVEARAPDSLGTTLFEPRSTGWGARSFRVAARRGESSEVVINEIMALNSKSLQDPQGDFDDWIELHNRSDHELDLSGMYLSDKADNPRKWAFPPGTRIAAGGYLIVWADEDGARGEPAPAGLHANFKLSGRGETLLLVDSDQRGNLILDSVTFAEQLPDVSFGRFPDGAGELRLMYSTPGRSNGP